MSVLLLLYGIQTPDASQPVPLPTPVPVELAVGTQIGGLGMEKRRYRETTIVEWLIELDDEEVIVIGL